MRITIIGHSQLPRDNGHFDGHHVRWFRLGGADLRDVGGIDRRLGLALTEPQDIIILFLGGNDVFRYSRKENKENLSSVINTLKGLTPMLYVIPLEARDYRKHPRKIWAARWKYYNEERGVLNKQIRRGVYSIGYRTINLSTADFCDRRPDGVHFTWLGRYRFYMKIRRTVLRRVEEIAEQNRV